MNADVDDSISLKFRLNVFTGDQVSFIYLVGNVDNVTKMKVQQNTFDMSTYAQKEKPVSYTHLMLPTILRV